MQGNMALFVCEEDALVESFVSSLGNSQAQVIGPELIFGRIYDRIGYGRIARELFRHLVITRLHHPGSKLKTIDYLQRFWGIYIGIVKYRFIGYFRCPVLGYHSSHDYQSSERCN